MTPKEELKKFAKDIIHFEKYVRLLGMKDYLEISEEALQLDSTLSMLVKDVRKQTLCTDSKIVDIINHLKSRTK